MATTRDRPTVLLIEDNLTQLDLYALVLEGAFEVLKATRGETGYALACSARPDAIVVDVLLPDADGLELCERLLASEQTQSAALVVLTGDDAAFERAATMRLLDAVLKKPCSADRLLLVLHRAISARQGQ